MEAAYHEAGHAVFAALLGGRVVSATIERNAIDTPHFDGCVSVQWPSQQLSAHEQVRTEVLTALAGPVAEMIYRGEKLHPARVQEWANDWHTAMELTTGIVTDPLRRIALLEKLCQELFRLANDARIWQAIAEVADLLDTHETIDGEEVHETLDRWTS